MRRALVLVLLLGVAALAEDETKLPWNPWEKAAAGDWEALRSEVKGDKKGASAVPELVTFEIRGADEKEIKLGKVSVPASDDDRLAVVHARAETPTLEKLFSLTGKAEGVKTAEEKKKIGDKDVACTRVSFKAKTRLAKADAAISLWLSKEVKGLGLVEEVVEGGGVTVTWRLSGWGTKDKVEWGTKPEKK